MAVAACARLRARDARTLVVAWRASCSSRGCARLSAPGARARARAARPRSPRRSSCRRPRRLDVTHELDVPDRSTASTGSSPGSPRTARSCWRSTIVHWADAASARFLAVPREPARRRPPCSLLAAPPRRARPTPRRALRASPAATELAPAGLAGRGRRRAHAGRYGDARQVVAPAFAAACHDADRRQPAPRPAPRGRAARPRRLPGAGTARSPRARARSGPDVVAPAVGDAAMARLGAEARCARARRSRCWATTPRSPLAAAARAGSSGARRRPAAERLVRAGVLRGRPPPRASSTRSCATRCWAALTAGERAAARTPRRRELLASAAVRRARRRSPPTSSTPSPPGDARRRRGARGRRPSRALAGRRAGGGAPIALARALD